MSTDHTLRSQRYAEWLAGQDLKFNFGAELAALADRKRGPITNDTPPVESWHRIIPTVQVIEKVREQFGPVTITSAYRALAYNLAVGGEKASWHMKNVACDIQCRQATPEQVGQFLKNLRATGFFSGGIGIYGSFVHVDTRGTNVDWRGK